jgi:hypothetical protein
MGTSDLIKNVLCVLENSDKIIACSQLLIWQAYKKSSSNTSLFWYTKKTNIYIWVCIFWTIQILPDFIIILSHKKLISNQICMNVDYIINYVEIYFHNFLKYKNIIFIFNFFWRDHESLGAKNTFHSHIRWDEII